MAATSARRNAATRLGGRFGVQVGSESTAAELELAPGGVVTSLRRIQLDDQAVGGFVGRVVVEDLIEEGMRLALPAGVNRPSGGLHRHDLPAGEEMFARADQPVLVDIVGEQGSSSQLQHGCHRVAFGFGGAISVGLLVPNRLGGTRRPRGMAEQVEGGP
jgi:hypothetical protein